MIAAILLAQWRSMRTFRFSAKPATAIFSSITGVIFYGFWAVMAFGAEAFFANPDNAQYFSLVLTSGLLLMFLYWQVTPVITASMGAALDLKKLLVYPVPREKLFFVELLLRFTTCAEMLIVLFGFVFGLARNPQLGGIAALPRLFATLFLFVLFNMLLSAGVRNLLERILLRRRIREVLMFLIVIISVLPQILVSRGFHGSSFRDAVPEVVWLPWSAAGHLFLGSRAVLACAVLIGFVSLAYLFSRWQFERSLRFEGYSETVNRPAEAVSRWEGVFRFPSRFLPDPTAAIMEKELRSLLRTPPFRLIFIMGASFGLVLWLPQLLRKGAAQHGFLAENVVTFATLYSVLMLGQVTFFNCFGFERSAVQVWFSVPVPIIRTLVAKNLTALLFICFEIVFVTLGGILFRMQVTPIKFLETVCVTLLAAVYLISFGNLASVRLPRILQADKMNQSGSSKAMNALILLCFPVVLLPIALAYWARSVFESELSFFLLLALAAIFGGILYWVGLTSAADIAAARRENILADLSRGEGPVSIS